MLRFLPGLIAFACLAPQAGATAVHVPRVEVLQTPHRIDAVSGEVTGPSVVIVSDGKIKAVGGAELLPSLLAKGAHVREFDNATLLPGLIDAHSHPLITGDDYQLDHMRRSSPEKALLGLAALQANLRAGWTTLRVAGDADTGYVVSDLKKVLLDRVFFGPRLTGAAHYLSITAAVGTSTFSRRSSAGCRGFARMGGSSMGSTRCARRCGRRFSSGRTGSSCW